MALAVTLRRINSDTTITATARTDDPTEAIARVGRRKLGYPMIGTIEHFRGGGTYHVQFGREVGGPGSWSVSLSDLYVAQVERA